MISITIKIPQSGIQASVCNDDGQLLFIVIPVNDEHAVLIFEEVVDGKRIQIIPRVTIAKDTEVDISIDGDSDEKDMENEMAYFLKLENYLKSKGLV